MGHFPPRDRRTLLEQIEQHFHDSDGMMDNNRFGMAQVEITPQQTVTIDFVNGTGVGGSAAANTDLAACAQDLLCNARIVTLKINHPVYVWVNEQKKSKRLHYPTQGEFKISNRDLGPISKLYIKDAYPNDTTYEHQFTQITLIAAGRYAV